MATLVPGSKLSLRRSARIGVAVGTGVFLVFLVAGLLFASWSPSEFLSTLSLETVGWFLILGVMTVAIFAIPIAFYLHSRIGSPLVLLGGIVLAWFAIGVSAGIFEAGAFFGLSLYAASLSPFYVVAYLVFGGAEHFARKRRFGSSSTP